MTAPDRTKLQQRYEPQLKKSLRTVLQDKIETEYGLPGGTRTAQVIADDIVDTVQRHHLSAETLTKGQTLWMAVSIEGKSAHGNGGLENAPLVPVILTTASDADIEARSNGATMADIRKRRVKRILEEAYEQGGVLTGMDVALLLSFSEDTAYRIITEIEDEQEELLPTRGSVHDIGRKLSHKVEIVRMVKIEGRSPVEAAKRTNHAQEDVDRYLADFERIEKLAEHYDDQEIAMLIGRSESLVNEHLELVEEIHSLQGAE
jgi:hypothetical protein